MVEHVLAQLAGAKLFSKLDANFRFYQIPLDPRSPKLTTFITSFSIYYHNRLPFGIMSAPKHFHKRISKILSGVTGTVSMIDNVPIFEEKNRRDAINTLQWLSKRVKELG